MADEPGKKPTPRPRRRRSDWDPTYQPPSVKHERRRTRTSASKAAAAGGATAGAAAAVTGAATEPPFPDEPSADSPSTSDAPSSAGGDAAAIEAAEQAAAIEAAAVIEADAAGLGAASTVATDSWLPVLDGRSPDPAVCPFLRSVGADDVLGPPIESYDAANRCAALSEAVPQSLRQQELVCLTGGHVDCPRYLRGAAVVTDVPSPTVRPGRTLTPAVLASIGLLVGAFVLSIGFVAVNGGLDLAAAPAGTPTASAGAIAAGSPTAEPTPVATSTPAPTPTVAPTATSAPTATAAPTPEPTPEPTAEPTPDPTPTSDRYRLLRPCPDRDDCWIYVVRSGDNLFSIANYFGVPLQTVYDWNPWTETSGLRPGRELRMPPPTR